MDEQLDGFEFTKIENGMRFYALNKKHNYVVFWLGSDPDRSVMEMRINQYGSPAYVEPMCLSRHDALVYYRRAEKANEKAMREELERTANKPVTVFGERFNPLSQWRHQPRF